jgi:hypothetical protein
MAPTGRADARADDQWRKPEGGSRPEGFIAELFFATIT